nr:hypothetical protein [uncultured Dongia sp.]
MQPAQVTTMRKGDFARLRQVSAARVSQWIKEGKIYGEAIVGTGLDARINAEVANSQLGATLDITQSVAQTRPSLDPALPPLSDAARRTQDARAEQAEIEARRSRRRELEEMGIYVRADATSREWSRTLAQLLSGLEELIPMLGDAIAAECHADAKAATVVLRREVRAWRERQMLAALEVVAAEPELIEDAAIDA